MTAKKTPAPSTNGSPQIHLSKNLLPPEVLDALPEGLSDEAAFIFWSGWQRATAIRDAYWETRSRHQIHAEVEEEGMARILHNAGAERGMSAEDVAEVGADIGVNMSAYAIEEKKQSEITAAPPGPGQEAPIGPFSGEAILPFVEFAVNNSTDRMRARLIVRELLENCKDNYPSGNPPGSIVRQITSRLDDENIRGNAVQDLGDGSKVSDAAVEESNFS